MGHAIDYAFRSIPSIIHVIDFAMKKPEMVKRFSPGTLEAFLSSADDGAWLEFGSSIISLPSSERASLDWLVDEITSVLDVHQTLSRQAKRCIFALGWINTPRSHEQLTNLTKSKDDGIAGIAVFVLGEIAASCRPEQFLSFLQHRSKSVREAAVFALGWNQGNAAWLAISESAFAKDPNVKKIKEMYGRA